jgi:mRNA interferase MazF
MAPGLIQRGSIVLIRYPFTDLSSSKVRPAVVLTTDQLLRKLDEAIFLFISSVMPAVVIPSDYILTTDHPAFPATGLKVDSVFRAHKIITLHKSMVARTIGAANGSLMQSITRCLEYALGM